MHVHLCGPPYPDERVWLSCLDGWSPSSNPYTDRSCCCCCDRCPLSNLPDLQPRPHCCRCRWGRAAPVWYRCDAFHWWAKHALAIQLVRFSRRPWPAGAMPIRDRMVLALAAPGDLLSKCRDVVATCASAMSCEIWRRCRTGRTDIQGTRYACLPNVCAMYGPNDRFYRILDMVGDRWHVRASPFDVCLLQIECRRKQRKYSDLLLNASCIFVNSISIHISFHFSQCDFIGYCLWLVCFLFFWYFWFGLYCLNLLCVKK